jgi:Xaa-Pro aminopeptidase
VGERVGADAVEPVAALGERLPELLRAADRIHFRIGTGRRDVEALVLDILGSGRSARQRSGRGPATLIDPGLVLDELRLVKEPGEVTAIRDAVEVTVVAFREALAAVRPGAGEWQVEAALEAAIRRAGADGPAFTTIAASGPNAAVLHYTANRRVMQESELLLLDGGARHRIYNADLTRTVPVGGRFPQPARELYDVVLAARDAAIDAVRPGIPAREVHQAAARTLVAGMIDLGILDGDLDSLLDNDSAWKPFFPHSTSHWLGLDVHDVGTYTRDDRPRPLQPGMVLTVEPGLYMPAEADARDGDNSAVPPQFRGFGIRIEDDILVTDDGAENLSAELPADPDDIAALVGG